MNFSAICKETFSLCVDFELIKASLLSTNWIHHPERSGFSFFFYIFNVKDKQPTGQPGIVQTGSVGLVFSLSCRGFYSWLVGDFFWVTLVRIRAASERVTYFTFWCVFPLTAADICISVLAALRWLMMDPIGCNRLPSAGWVNLVGVIHQSPAARRDYASLSLQIRQRTLNLMHCLGYRIEGMKLSARMNLNVFHFLLLAPP